jgi:hypothetical protein
LIAKLVIPKWFKRIFAEFNQLLERGIQMKEGREAFGDMLSAALARVVDFLKFAEAKNAALLTFASAWYSPR